ncbi:phospholipase A2, group IVB [Achlya hypogyna]|uniref:Phospholipase A2, group IVB n=1 Tax=Achlya hypogyna TaxID=1202772 RepID=A0A0A7CNZ7_ACHHY|nr:secreted protein [Achlya hypogyna]OQR87611.1 phospholipase A2, group IVB [Achlya hypogyna]
MIVSASFVVVVAAIAVASPFDGASLNASCRSFVYNGPAGGHLLAFREAKAAFAAEDLCFVEQVSALPSPSLLYYPKHDASAARTCLLPGLPPVQAFSGLMTADSIVHFVNRHAHTFRALGGSLQPISATVHRLESELYTVDAPECESVDASEMTEAHFRAQVLGNKPLIIRNAATKAMLSSKWSTQSLLERIGTNDVHVKVSPNGNFEGCEPLAWWEGADVPIPAFVEAHLESPDTVLVRPAATNMPFADFVRRLHEAQASPTSYYLEYLSLTTYAPELLSDIPSYAWADFLQLHVQNLWFGDGKSVGKLHFDAFENIMVMVAGAKEFVLYDPSDNTRFYEGHIREAKYRLHNGDTFTRDDLMESTSMVNSPVDIDAPDLQRYPRFAAARPMTCKIHQGDALYLPSFWWHEVRSSPAEDDPRNVAVNFWYTPVYTKDFPCSTCPLQYNPDYLHLLEAVAPKDEL